MTTRDDEADACTCPKCTMSPEMATILSRLDDLDRYEAAENVGRSFVEKVGQIVGSGRSTLEILADHWGEPTRHAVDSEPWFRDMRGPGVDF